MASAGPLARSALLLVCAVMVHVGLLSHMTPAGVIIDPLVLLAVAGGMIGGRGTGASFGAGCGLASDLIVHHAIRHVTAGADARRLPVRHHRRAARIGAVVCSGHSRVVAGRRGHRAVCVCRLADGPGVCDRGAHRAHRDRHRSSSALGESAPGAGSSLGTGDSPADIGRTTLEVSRWMRRCAAGWPFWAS